MEGANSSLPHSCRNRDPGLAACFDVVIIGGSQAGLALGHCLARSGLSFVILEASARVGDAWRRRWDSLRLFTPASHSALPGLPFPGPPDSLPAKDEVADYLEAYAEQFALPVRLGTRVTSVERDGAAYAVVTADGRWIAAGQVVIATGAHHRPHTPALAAELHPSIPQLHSSEYRNPWPLPGRRALVVGAGNSGAEIALDLARAGRQVVLSGRDPGRIPAATLVRIFGGRAYWWLLSRFLSVRTPIGRRVQAQALRRGAPLIGTSRRQVSAAGVRLAARTTAVKDGRPVLATGEVLDVDAVIWATGFRSDFSWVNLQIFDERGHPLHRCGRIPGVPGIYFLGLLFQSALTSNLLGGVGEDAARLAQAITARAAELEAAADAETLA